MDEYGDLKVRVNALETLMHLVVGVAPGATAPEGHTMLEQIGAVADRLTELENEARPSDSAAAEDDTTLYEDLGVRVVAGKGQLLTHTSTLTNAAKLAADVDTLRLAHAELRAARTKDRDALNVDREQQLLSRDAHSAVAAELRMVKRERDALASLRPILEQMVGADDEASCLELAHRAAGVLGAAQSDHAALAATIARQETTIHDLRDATRALAQRCSDARDHLQDAEASAATLLEENSALESQLATIETEQATAEAD